MRVPHLPEPRGPGVRHVHATRASSVRTCAGLRRSAVTPAGACRSTSASRAARSAAASASLRGRGPISPVRTCSATGRSIGSPSADSSAHSSSAVDSPRAVATAIGRSASPASAACCCPATAQGQLGPPGDPLGVVRPAAADPLGAQVPVRRHRVAGVAVVHAEQVERTPAGIVSVASPRSRAQAQPGSARQPPNSSRCAAAMSQHVASRTPSAANRAAVWPDHTTHRGRTTSSPARSRRPGPDPATGQVSAVASPDPSAGDDQPDQVAAVHPRLAQRRHELRTCHGPTLPRTGYRRRALPRRKADPGVRRPHLSA